MPRPSVAPSRLALRVAAGLLCVVVAACSDSVVAPVDAPTLIRPVSLQVPAPNTYTQGEGGVFHTCALRGDGAVDCWGDNGLGQAPATKTAGIGAFTQVSAGGYQSCARRSDGVVECWGNNLSGQAPPIMAATSGTFTQVGVGGYFGCALRDDGVVECWGDNSSGQAPATKAAASGTFTLLSPGTSHTCAVRNDGVIECWGSSSSGQAPAAKAATTGTFTQVSAGANHTCALRADGAVECWGDNGAGQAPATQMAVSGTFTQVGTGAAHSCALRGDGVVECWGNNGNGSAPPTRAAASGTFTALAVGWFHTCAGRSDGVVECWGYNGYGQAPATQTATRTTVRPTATFIFPSSVSVGDPVALALTDAQVPGHPEATIFTYAFDCGGGTFAAPSSTASASCPTTASGPLAVRGKVIDQDGDVAEYSASVDVAALSQTITFGSLGDKVYGATPFGVSATATSGLPVTFASLTTPVCTVSGTTVTVNVAGVCTIHATQAGNASWLAAPPVDQSFTVGYVVSKLQPAANTKFERGSTIPVWFQLTDAKGKPIPNTVARSLGCTVKVTFNGGSPTCANYIVLLQRFQANIKTPRNLTPGTSYPIVVTVTVGTTTVATATVNVIAK